MKRIFPLILSLIGISSVSEANEEKLVWFESINGVIKVQAPSNWQAGKNPDHFQIMNPTGSVVLTIGAYGKDGGSIQEFAQYRFSSVEEFYKPTSDEQKISNGSFLEFEGTWPGEMTPTYYVVAARQSEMAYFSIGLVTDRIDFTKNKKLYIAIFESIDVVKK